MINLEYQWVDKPGFSHQMYNKSKILEYQVENLGISSWKSGIIGDKLGISVDKPGFSHRMYNNLKKWFLDWIGTYLGISSWKS